jgi:hypothetical protein
MDAIDPDDRERVRYNSRNCVMGGSIDDVTDKVLKNPNVAADTPVEATSSNLDQIVTLARATVDDTIPDNNRYQDDMCDIVDVDDAVDETDCVNSSVVLSKVALSNTACSNLARVAIYTTLSNSPLMIMRGVRTSLFLRHPATSAQ